MAFVRKVKAALVRIDIDSYVGESSYLFYDIQTGELRISNGTAGGTPATQSWENMINTPTTIAGYGITDAGGDVGAYLSANGYDTATNIVASIVDTAPSTLNTLKELSTALGDDANFATTTATAIGLKVDAGLVPITKNSFTGDAAALTFTMSKVVADEEDILVLVGGLFQTPGIDYTTNNSTTLTFPVAPPNLQEIRVLHGYNLLV